MELPPSPCRLAHLFVISGFATTVLFVLVSGCGGAPEPKDDAADTNPELLPARASYRQHCAACHGKGGQGVPRLFPPLTGSEWLAGNPEAAIRVVLDGMDGPVSVGGERFLNKMAPLGQVLTDREIAEILTYVRASWGNSASAVSESEVTRTREVTRGRKKEWTETELRSLLTPDAETGSMGTKAESTRVF